MSATLINDLLQIWASTLSQDQDPPFTSKNEMYSAIDNLDLGGATWKSFIVKYNGEIKDGDVTPWKHKSFEVWYRDPRIVIHNQLGNREYGDEIDFASKDVRDREGRRRYSDFMSGNWSWRQSVCEFGFWDMFASIETKGGLNRMRLQKTPEIMDPRFAPPSLAVTRQLSQLEQGIMNITHCISPMGRFTTTFGVLTETQ
jgi:Plavaka transposase